MASTRLAVLFADVCDSTTIYESIGDTRALQLIKRLFVVLNEKVRSGGGRIIKTLGDSIVCQFKDADAAFQTACDLQAAALRAEASESPKLTIKVAFNFGPVVTERGDVFGDTVNVCARLVGVAGPQQVLTTQETIDTVSQALRERSRQLYPLRVRGRNEEVNVCEVLWRSDPDVTAALGLVKVENDAVLKLSYAGKTVSVEPSGSVKVGRDASNDLVVRSTHASRVHARVFGRGAHFVIADQSSNGTFVMIDGSSEVHLRREEGVLGGEAGTIGLGGPTAGEPEHVLRYQLESRKR